jgi:hypothetical protein
VLSVIPSAASLRVVILSFIILSVVILEVTASENSREKSSNVVASNPNGRPPGACTIKLFTAVIYGFFVIS